MKNLIKSQIKKYRWSVLSACLIASLFTCFMIYQVANSYSLELDLETWEIATKYIAFLFPLLVVIPTCWSLYYEKKNRYLIYTLPRISKKKYVLANWLVSALAGGLILFISMMIGVIVALYVKPEITSNLSYIDPVTEQAVSISNYHILGEIFVKQSLLYGVILSVWRAIIGMIIATMGVVFALCFDNIFVILTGPFVYVLLENFLFSVLGKPEYRLVTSFDPSCIDFHRITIQSMLVGPAIAIILTAAIYIYVIKIKKHDPFQV
ncbi:hypothetical protein lbkm_1088 [Lachnospiraceae bacterium KM106-2]|nr:hypothetical protein lbkm_1088 [Lachnospiraceae bacterium KM106-2]